jgi:AcrR family transcriptional regulator
MDEMPRSPTRPRGRPRSFNQADALEGAMRLFWAKGYDGASIGQLAQATGMPRATLYQIYGDKQGLFLAAIQRYVETRTATVAGALGPTGCLESDLRAFFAAVVDLALAEPDAPGCLISCVLADAAGANPRFREELALRYSALEGCIADRLAQEEDCAAPRLRAAVVAAMSSGLLLRARAGATRATLEGAAAEALSLLVPQQA